MQLAVVLPLCAKLKKLMLAGNEMGDNGAIAISEVLKVNGALKTLE